MGRGGEFEEAVLKYVKIKCLYGEKSTKEKIVNNLIRGNIIKAIRVAIYMILAIAYHTQQSFPVIYVSKHLNVKKDSLDLF